MWSSRPGGAAARPEYSLVRILAEAGTVADAAQGLLELIATEFGWVYGALWLADEEGELLRWAEGWSVEDPAVREFGILSQRLTYTSGVGLPGRVWESGEPAWIADLASEPNFPRAEAAQRAGLRAAAVVPVVGPTGVLGAMELLGRDVRAPEPEQLDLMGTLGRQVGQYVARIRAEERLRATEEVSASIVQAALDCIITMDATGRVLDFNPAAEEVFGYRREEALGRTVAELIVPPEHRTAHQRSLRRYAETGEGRILDRRLEMTGMRADGSTLPVELTVTRLGRADPPLFAGFVRDISARRRGEEEVAELLAREHDARIRAERAERSTRRVADVLQRSLLPPHMPAIPGVDLGAAYRAGAEGSAVGGDFYDVFALGPGRWGVAIGDVRGKGPDAAALTALVRYAIRTAAVRESSPAAVLGVVNEALLRDTPEDDFCTAIYASLDVSAGPPALSFAVGGHPLPVLACGGEVRAVGRPGTLLGVIQRPVFVDHEVTLGSQELLLLYTDGITESRTRAGLFGLGGLRALLAECGGLDAAAVVARIEARVVDAPAHTVADDVALLALRAG
jgi:PAS domain S-box-containing protein